MSSNGRRAALLTEALHAAVELDHQTLRKLCTDDLRTWTPARSTSSLDDLLAALQRRDEVFSEFVLETYALDVGGDLACVEWTMSMTHSGPMTVAQGAVIEPTGLRVTVTGTTVAEFRGFRVCGLRQYWDELGIFEQLGLLRNGRDGP